VAGKTRKAPLPASLSAALVSQAYSDTEYGGLSSASLRLSEQGEPRASRSGPLSPLAGDAAVLSGELSFDIRDPQGGEPAQERQLRRSGFCGVRTTDALEPLDLEAYSALEFTLLGDGRKYLTSLRTDTWLTAPGAAHDLWQAFLFAPPGEWAAVRVPLSRFLRTWRGKLIGGEAEMNARRVLSLGVSVAGGGGALEVRFAVACVAAALTASVCSRRGRTGCCSRRFGRSENERHRSSPRLQSRSACRWQRG